MNEPAARAISVPLGDVRECSCGVVVTVDRDGRRFDFETGRLHLHVVHGDSKGR